MTSSSIDELKDLNKSLEWWHTITILVTDSIETLVIIVAIFYLIFLRRLHHRK